MARPQGRQHAAVFYPFGYPRRMLMPWGLLEINNPIEFFMQKLYYISSPIEK
jgi:hypothetical protein